MFAVDDDRVAIASVGARSLPDFFHQHAGGVVVENGDTLADEAALVLVGGTEGGDDHDVVGGERIPERGIGSGRRVRPGFREHHGRAPGATVDGIG